MDRDNFYEPDQWAAYDDTFFVPAEGDGPPNVEDTAQASREDAEWDSQLPA